MIIQELQSIVHEEIKKAIKKHPPIHSPHEGYAVIKEELEELWDEIKAQNPDKDLMQMEAIHLAAMVMRFVLDICVD